MNCKALLNIAIEIALYKCCIIIIIIIIPTDSEKGDATSKALVEGRTHKFVVQRLNQKYVM